MTWLLADIASGEVDTADVLFLVAFVLSLVATFLAAAASDLRRWSAVAGWAALALVALAWMLL